MHAAFVVCWCVFVPMLWATPTCMWKRDDTVEVVAILSRSEESAKIMYERTKLTFIIIFFK